MTDIGSEEMILLNPNPKTGGYAYMPIRPVTSRFPAGVDVEGTIKAFTKAGVRAALMHVTLSR